ncbi:MAG: hypothetical protein AB1331_00030 [Bacillota bacterium]
MRLAYLAQHHRELAEELADSYQRLVLDGPRLWSDQLSACLIHIFEEGQWLHRYAERL